MTITDVPGPPGARPRRGIRRFLSAVYHEETHFAFVGHARRWAILSGAFLLVSIAGLVLNGLNLGIDFEGGTQWQVERGAGTAEAGEVRDLLAGTSAADAKVLVLGQGGVRVQSETIGAAARDQVTDVLAEYAGVEAGDVSVTEVGPTWGNQVTRKAVLALIVMLVLIALYLTFRFEWRMALASIIAVLHDIVVTVGFYAVTGLEVTPATVVAFLTILGFSLYDTVVVFDKVRENTPSVGVERGDTYSRMVDRSVNQVLLRSLNTSFVALLPIASLLVVGSVLLGGVTLRDFAVALFVGLAVGAYSSLFVASPLLAGFKEREPRYRSIRERATTQAARSATVPAGAPTRPAAPEAPAPTAAPGSGNVAPVGVPEPRDGPRRGVAPRPRQQRRRKRR